MSAALARPAALPEVPRDVAGVVRDELAPIVGAIDGGLYPDGVLRGLGAAGAYAHHTQGTPEGLIRAVEAMAAVGATCLSTAFCVWCQDALAWYLAHGDSLARDRHLADIANGVRLGGTGLSNPMKAFAGIEPLALTGRRVPGGYRVRGRLPWVSNLGPGHPFASIFALDDGRRVMAVFAAGQEGVAIAANARFVALEGTGTYTVMVRDAFVPDDDVIAPDAAAFVPRIRNGFVLLQAGMGLGLARGVAALMRADGRGSRDGAALPLGAEGIDARAADLWTRFVHAAERHADPAAGAFRETLRLRLDISWLALEAAQAAMLQFGARGYLEGSEPFRRLREAQFVAIVTPSVKHITRELAGG